MARKKKWQSKKQRKLTEGGIKYGRRGRERGTNEELEELHKGTFLRDSPQNYNLLFSHHLTGSDRDLQYHNPESHPVCTAGPSLVQH